MKKRSFYFMLCLSLILVILVLSGSRNKKITQNDVKNAAITAVSRHDNEKKESIKINKVKNLSNGDWFVLYQVKDRNGLWAPAFANYGVEIKEDSSGKLRSIFIKYGTVGTLTQGDSVTKFSAGSILQSWIQGTVTKSSSTVEIGSTLDISGQLARVQRNPNIQVTLYQSKGSSYQENAIQLAQKNVPVTGRATFDGTLTAPTFDKSNGGYFTLVFKYKGVPQAFAVSLQK